MQPRGIVRAKVLHGRLRLGARFGGPGVGRHLGVARGLPGLLRHDLIGGDFGTGNEGGGMRFGRYEGVVLGGGSIRTTR